MLAQIEKWLRIQTEESQLVWLLFLFSITTGGSAVFSYTAAFSLFLSAFEETSFAYVFITAGILSLVIGTLFTRLEQTVPKHILFIITLGLLLVSSLLIQIGIWAGVGTWLFWIMLVWYRLSYILTNMAFWGILSRVLNVEQGKRLIGTIASGELIILIIGYFITPWVVQQIGVHNLLVPNTLIILASILVVSRITPYLQEEGPAPSAEPPVPAKASSAGSKASIVNLFRLFNHLFSQSYIRYIFILSFLTVFSYFIIDYGFYGAVRTQFNDPVSLATFIGYFWTSVYTVSLLIRFFATNQILARFGLFFGLIALPITFGILSIAFLIGNIVSAPFVIILALVSLIKLIEDSFVSSIHRTSSTLLYQPMQRGTSLSAQIVAESLIAPLGLGIAGLFILLFNNLPAFTLTWLAVIFLVVAIVWIWSTREVFKGYVGALTKALSQRRLQGSILELNDSASLAVLDSYLISNDPRKIVYVLTLFEKLAPERLVTQIEAFALHHNDQVARTAIQIIGRLGLVEALPTVRKVADQQSPVSPEALYTLITLDPNTSIKQATPYLDHPNVDLAGQAILGLLSQGGEESRSISIRYLMMLARSEKPERREKSAAIIGQLPRNSYSDLLEELVRDKHGSVRKTALNSFISIQFDDPHKLKQTINKFSNDITLFQQILYTLRYSENPQASNILFQYVTHSTPVIRTHALEGLSNLNYELQANVEIEQVKQAIEMELVLATWATVSLSDIADKTDTKPLQGALEDLFADSLKRIFKLLGLMYNRQIVERVEIEYKNAKDKRQKTLALEALVTHIDYKHQTDITPFLLYEDHRTIWQNLKSQRGNTRMLFHERLHQLISNITIEGQDISPWVRSTAIYAAGKRKERTVSETIKRLQIARNELIKETAIWATERFQQA